MILFLLKSKNNSKPTNTNSHSFVTVDHVWQKLASCRNGNALSVSEFKHATLFGKDPVPVHAICGTSSNCSKHELVDLNNFLHALWTYEILQKSLLTILIQTD